MILLDGLDEIVEPVTKVAILEGKTLRTAVVDAIEDFINEHIENNVASFETRNQAGVLSGFLAFVHAIASRLWSPHALPGTRLDL